MDPAAIAKLVSSIVAGPMGDQLREIRQLRKELDHLRREIVLIKSTERGRQIRQTINATAAYRELLRAQRVASAEGPYDDD
jgi:hypothetical protein